MNSFAPASRFELVRRLGRDRRNEGRNFDKPARIQKWEWRYWKEVEKHERARQLLDAEHPNSDPIPAANQSELKGDLRWLRIFK